MFKQNKALDLNKLFMEQAKGKLLRKHLKFPVYAGIKYDGNSTVTDNINELIHYTSGNLTYQHTDDGADIFNYLPKGYYLAERIAGDGKLGMRKKCNLRGPKSNQTSTGHSYRIFGYLTEEEYNGVVEVPGYNVMYFRLAKIFLDLSTHAPGNVMESVCDVRLINTMQDLKLYLKEVVNQGYEGLMVMDPQWKWKNTASRTTDLVKYKKRPTADLKCIDTEEGKGKYVGVTGSLVLQDSEGRMVSVGSGLSDVERCLPPSEFIGKIIEIEYEQIMDTYIQPVYIGVRDDKQESD